MLREARKPSRSGIYHIKVEIKAVVVLFWTSTALLLAINPKKESGSENNPMRTALVTARNSPAMKG